MSWAAVDASPVTVANWTSALRTAGRRVAFGGVLASPNYNTVLHPASRAKTRVHVKTCSGRLITYEWPLRYIRYVQNQCHCLALCSAQSKAKLV
jgi:hypothetical protein